MKSNKNLLLLTKSSSSILKEYFDLLLSSVATLVRTKDGLYLSKADIDLIKSKNVKIYSLEPDLLERNLEDDFDKLDYKKLLDIMKDHDLIVTY